jgi:hypothetical protein
MAFGKLIYKPEDHFYAHWREVVTFADLRGRSSSKDTPSPRYWLLWPGVLAMIAISFTELFLQWRIILYAFKAAYRGIAHGLYDLGKKVGRDMPFLNVKEPSQDNAIQDPATDDELPAWWMWFPGLIVSIIGMCAVLGGQYDMPVGMSLLSVFLAFFFSFLAIQCTGVTGTTPAIQGRKLFKLTPQTSLLLLLLPRHHK